jgi:excisionase family DNA binding protein
LQACDDPDISDARLKPWGSVELKQNRLTYDLPEVAEKLGIGRNQAYEAAARGEIPTVRIGKRLLVPIRAFEAMLDRPPEAA